MKDKIGSIEAIALVIIIILNHIILSLPKNILSNTSSASIINIIFITIIALIFITFVNKFLSKFPGYNILKISEFLGGKTLKYITGILFIVYFIFISSLTMRSFCENLKIIYFQNYPILFLLGLFTLAIVGCNLLGIKSIIRGNLIIFPVLVISIIFIFFANLGNLNYNRIFPILGNDFYSTFFSGMSNLYAFSAIAILYFLPPYLNNSKEIKKISYISIISSSILLIFSVSSVLLMFPFIENIEQIPALYLVARYIEFGRFFQRIDAAFLLIWIISIISYLSFAFSLINNIFKELVNITNENMLIGSFGLITFGVSLIPKNLVQIRFLENTVYKYSAIFMVFIFSFIVLLFAYTKKSKEQLKNKESENIDEEIL